jgi:hypothetical protein
VALCDNKNQGIVPVPALIGNGQDPRNNLYWGSATGVKTWFNRKRGWRPVAVARAAFPVLERIAVRKTVGRRSLILVADAYDGAHIFQAIRDFLVAAAGESRADLVAYVGHNALMERALATWPARSGADDPPEAVVLACKSKPYFREPLRRTGSRALLWTTGLMAPEAYTLEAVLEGKLRGHSAAQIREAAARAYDKYQRCGRRAARRLFESELSPR